VLVVTRYRVEESAGGDFLARAQTALDALAARPGWRAGRIGRAVDDADLWVLSTEWDSVGAYRRALSGYDVKVHAVPLLSLALDEPTAFEVLRATGAGSDGLAGPSGLAPGAEQVRGGAGQEGTPLPG
jgi:hypothetical protein